MSKQCTLQLQLLVPVLLILLIILVKPVVASTGIKNTCSSTNKCKILTDRTTSITTNNRGYIYQFLHKLDPTTISAIDSSVSRNKNTIIRQQQQQQQQQQQSCNQKLLALIPLSFLFDNKISITRLVFHRQQRQQQQQQQQQLDNDTLSHMISTIIPRGGGGGGGSTSITNSFIQFTNYISQSYQRCFILLLFSIICENFGISLSKQARNIGSVKLFICSTVLNMLCLIGFNISLSQIEVSVAYAIWSAVGTMIVSTVGILYFNESCSILKLCCLSLIAIGVIGLNLI